MSIRIKQSENKKMNRLKDESSPYLLQHAENPVDWYPWGDEAFARAQAEDKPIFLSIGYSTCHWCHVMARESFSDEKVAGILNRDFVSIKVDREERPDIDAVYMEVCQAMTGSGGWPMTIFMTPEQKPFFAGTYFPKTSGMGMVGFCELAEAVAAAWKGKRKQLEDIADGMLRQLRQRNRENPRHAEGAEAVWQGGRATRTAEGAALQDKLFKLQQEARTQLAKTFDAYHGGFGRAPKFPMAHQLLFLMDQYTQRGDEQALSMAERTLVQMYKGGLYDHLGGGFARYSTDEYFLVPHFEKMLYDNALLISAYSRAYRLTGRPLYLRVAEETAQWALSEMCSGKGGFYASQDADSQGEEGKFYTFSYKELLGLLGAEEGKAFNAHYGCTESGNFSGKNILHLLNHERPDEAEQTLRDQVYQYRKKRFALHTDDKQLTAWNGLMIAALSDLAAAAGKSAGKVYLRAARGAAQCILQQLNGSTDLFTSYRLGEVRGSGLLEDYACFIYALLRLYAQGGELDDLDKASRFAAQALRLFFDEENGGFWLWGAKNEKLILNQKETHDGAMPSGNSLMADNLVHLAHYSRNERFLEAAEKQMAFMAQASEAYPAGHCFFLLAASAYLHPQDFYVCKDGICAPVGGKAVQA